MNCIYWFLYVIPPWIPDINATWSWCIITFSYCWIYFTNILLRIFESVLMKNIDLCFLGYRCLVSEWGYGELIESIGKCFLHFCFLKDLCRIKVFFFLNGLVEFTNEGMWVISFLQEKIFSYEFNFLNWHRHIQSF